MKITLIFLFTLILGSSACAQTNSLFLKGKIGTYKIEMEITNRDYITGDLEGKYNYKGKSAHLDLTGTTFNSGVILEETYEGEPTGTFYLSFIDEKLEGKWIHNKKWYDVELKVVSGDTTLLQSKTLEEYSQEVNNDLSGVYGTETYFMNDMWFSEETPQMEVGFNGGYLVLEQIHADSIRFETELICGPTYHFAVARGVAVLTDSCYLYQNDDGCIIEILPNTEEKTVFIEANSSFDCGFGMRAHMYHSLIKVSNEIPEEEEWPSLPKILGRESQKI